MSQTLAALRGLLQQPPSQETWRRVRDLLDALRPHAAPFIKRWPAPALAPAQPLPAHPRDQWSALAP